MTLATITAILNIALKLLLIAQTVFELIERWMPTLLS